MNQDSIDDSGKPFEPETPEAFFQRREEAFQIWWSELDPPGVSGGLKLDYEAARAVWSAACEYCATYIALIYDGADANADGAHSTGEMHLACVVDCYHSGSVTLPSREFLNWVAEHEDHIRREYFEDEHDADPGAVTVWIDHAGQSPSSAIPTRRVRPTSSEQLRSGAEKEFAQWWKQLDPSETLAFTSLDRKEARVVWLEAYVRLWEELEVVHDSARAYADVVAETAWLELAYIIDRLHNGKLTVAVSDMMPYWNENVYTLERQRTDDAIILRVLRVNEDSDE